MFTLLRNGGMAAALVLAGVAAPVAAVSADAMAQPYAYVADLDGDVKAIDLGTGVVAATIPTGSETTDVALNPADTRAYATSAVAGTVSVIDTSTNTVVDTIDVGGYAYGLVLSPSGSTIYVAVQGGPLDPSGLGAIAEIDAATDSVIATIPVKSPAVGLALSPDGMTLYVAGGGDGGADGFANAVIDLATGTITASMVTGPAEPPSSVAVSADGSKVYGENFNAGGGSVTVMDAATDTLTTTIPGIGWSGQIAADPNGSVVYVPGGSGIEIINAATDTLEGGIDVCDYAYGVTFSPDGSLAYVGCGGKIDVIETATSTVIGSIVTGGGDIYAIALPQSLTPTTTTVTTSPAGTANQGDTVTVHATESPAATGTMQFYDDGSALGTAVPVDASGTATYATSSLPTGTHVLTAVFEPDAATFVGSTSQPVDLQVVVPALAISQSIGQDGTGTVTTAPFSTPGPRLLVAFTSSDGPGTKQNTTVTGGGLTWQLAARANTKGGTAEIWYATASTALSSATVTSTPKAAGYDQMLTIEAFTGASGVGASATAGKNTGAPSVSLTTTQPGSWVFGVGEDYSAASSRATAAGQSLIAQWIDTTPGETFWVQDLTAVTPAAGTVVTLADTAPTKDIWNLAAAEILPAS